MATLAIAHKTIGAFNLILTYRQTNESDPLSTDEIATLLLKMVEMHKLRQHGESTQFQYNNSPGQVSS